jgi:hypothetical protein
LAGLAQGKESGREGLIMTRQARCDPFGLGYWEGVIVAWQKILERWAVEMGEQIEPELTDAGPTGAARVDKTLSTELVAGADLAPDMPADIPHERQPVALAAARHIRRTLTRTTRRDLGRAMTDMCEPGGWRVTTLNPDLPDPRKFAILSDRFDKISQSDDPHVLYAELLGLAAVAAGWAQGIERRAWRDAKRASRAARRADRATRRNRGRIGPAGHGDVDRAT